MKNLVKNIAKYSTAFFLGFSSLVPAHSQEPETPKDGTKFSASYLSWNKNYLDEKYNGMFVFQLGCGYKIKNNFNNLRLGWNLETGSAKAKNSYKFLPKKTPKVDYFSANIEIIPEMKKFFIFSLYPLFGGGISFVEEKNIYGGEEKKTTSLNGYFGPGFNIEASKKMYFYAEVKENFSKPISKEKILESQKTSFSFGVKLNF